MPLKFIDLNYPSIVAFNCDNRNVMVKEKNSTQQSLKSQKIDDKEIGKNTSFSLSPNRQKGFKLVLPKGFSLFQMFMCFTMLE